MRNQSKEKLWESSVTVTCLNPGAFAVHAFRTACGFLDQFKHDSPLN